MMAAGKREERREIAWVSFVAGARMSSQSSAVPAMATGGTTKLYKQDIDGIPHVLVEDASLPFPASIPWSNVASVGWANPVTQ